MKNTGYPVPANEAERLKALHDLRILDTPRDPDFDTIIDMAKTLFGVPIAVVSLLDEDRQWFKASCGLSASETSRKFAFCNYTISSGQLFVVENAVEDPRFATNALVTGDPHIRFYAGVPLDIGNGLMAGSLCIIDTKPRQIGAGEVALLRQLATIAESLLRHSRNATQNQELSHALTVKQDLLEQQADSLRIQKHILDCASDLAKIGAWEIDLRTGEVIWSEGMCLLHEVDLDFQPQQDTLKAFYSPKDMKRLEAAIAESVRDNTPYMFEGPMTTAKGNRRWVRVNAKVEFQNGVAVRRYGMKQDITEEKKALDLIKRMAERDALTGLHNRASLLKRLDEVAARGNDVALLLLDLDGFKDINDTHGHAAGDLCLKHMAKRLDEVRGWGRFISRMGGDEFAIVVEGLEGVNDIVAIAEVIKKAASQPVKWREQSFQFSTSIGIAVRQAGAEFLPADMMSEADLALYRSKNSGRDCFSMFEPAMREVSERRASVIEDIRKALCNGELELYYQAKIALKPGRVGGFEALLRWNSPGGKVMGPDVFRAALEDPLLSVKIGDFVLAAALDQAACWRDRGVPFGSIAINFGGQQFRDPNLGQHILAEIARRSLDPRMVEIEVTEDVFLSRSADAVLKTCRLLRENGVGVSFDDFGTGFASLTHLLEFPMSAIKIDRTFVARLSTRAGTTAVINAICELGKSLGVDVVAEGVETEDQLLFLRSIGCDFVQGYLFHRPSPAEHAERFCIGSELRFVA